MQKTDITGNPLPVLLVSGCTVYPPKLITVKAAAKLSDIIKSILYQIPNNSELSLLYTLLREILNNNDQKKDFKIKELAKQPLEDVLNVITAYADLLQKIHKAHPLPEIHCETDGYRFTTHLSWDKVVADFANMSILEVQNLCYVDFVILRREAFISNLAKAEEGREKLEEAYCFEQTEPDRATLRSYFGGGIYAQKQ